MHIKLLFHISCQRRHHNFTIGNEIQIKFIMICKKVQYMVLNGYKAIDGMVSKFVVMRASLVLCTISRFQRLSVFLVCYKLQILNFLFDSCRNVSLKQ